MKISLALIFSMLFLISENTSDVDFKGVQKPIKIFVQKFSPAFAALEDSFDVKTSTLDIVNTFKTNLVPIKSGETELRIVKLDGFKIQRSKPLSIVSATKSITQSVSQKVASVTKDILDHSFDISAVSLNKNHGYEPEARLSASVNKKIKVDGVDFEISTPSNLSSNKSLDEISEDLSQDLMVPRIANLMNLNNIGKLSSSTDTKSSKNLSAYALSPIGSNKIQSQILNGRIELAGGAVYPGERFEFYIQREFDGLVQERGEVDSWTGEYSIAIKEPKGLLRIELRHDSGALIAIGHLDLKDKSNLQSENVIQVFPSEDAHNIGQVLSYESFEDHDIAVEEPTEIYIDGNESIDVTDKKGRIANNLPLASGSQILVSASHKGYWNSLQIAEAGMPIKTVMHSDKHMKAFLQLIEPYLKKAKIKSVIWGRVSSSGNSKSNVKVSLHSFNQIQPLYFSYRIPDPTLEATSSDGFFAFVNPPEGLHIIKTDRSDIPLESVVVRQGHTSIVHLETAPKKDVNIYSFEAFGEKSSVPARLSIPGTDSIWSVGGVKFNKLPFFDTSTNMVLDVEPVNYDYMSTRFFIGRRRLAVQLPHFKKTWLKSVLAQNKVNQIPGTTQVLGWIESGSYKVDVFPRIKDTQIIYFNLKGQVVENLTEGGGYIATNVPAGVITSTLKNTQTYETIKRLSISEPYRLSVNYIDTLN